MINKKYITGVSLQHILEDGWRRDFEVSQTMSEEYSMGFIVTEELVKNKWKELEESFCASFYII